jgi:uncharacterized RDD family membrane protein YckC
LDTLILVVPTILLESAIRSDYLFNHAARPHVGVGTQIAAVVVGLVIGLGYPFVFLRCGGRTVGMMATGIRAVDRVTGGPLSTAQVVRRILAFFLLVDLWNQLAEIIDFNSVFRTTRTYSFGNTSVSTSSVHYPWVYVVVLLIGFAGLLMTAFWALGNPANQTLQDKAAGTIVVRWRG